jgi:CBS domain-containing protein
MTVARILAAKGRDVVTTLPHQTLTEAAGVLVARNIGAIVVVDAYGPYGHVLGILSERDIVHAIAKAGAAAFDDPVSTHMLAPAVTVGPDESINATMQKMTVRRCRHLPVLDKEERLVGIISIGDVIKYRLEQLENDYQAMRDYIATA